MSTSAVPEQGQLVEVRRRRFVVSDVVRFRLLRGQTRLRLVTDTDHPRANLCESYGEEGHVCGETW